MVSNQREFFDAYLVLFFTPQSLISVNVNHYGQPEELLLPNSKIIIGYSTKYFRLLESYTGGFKQDIAINQSFEHYIQGIDDIYEAASNYK